MSAFLNFGTPWASANLLPLLLCGTLASYIICAIWRVMLVKAQRQKLLLIYGCKAPTRYPHSGPPFGLDLLSILAKAVRKHRYLKTTQRLLEKHGNTVEYRILGNAAFITIDPENIKTVIAKNFGHYSLGKQRKSEFQPFFGNGIFNSDGPVWEVSWKLVSM
jgi:hypothetical protein